MKALFCGACTDIRALDPTPDDDGAYPWVTCRCGNTSARWVNAFAGTAEFRAVDKSKVRILGLHNHMIQEAFDGPWRIFEAAREMHDAITEHSTGYVFHKYKAACWAVLISVGQTTDVTWASDDD